MTALIYGANGYVGRLAVAAAAEQGLDVVAAARSDSIVEVADSHGVPHRIGTTDGIDLDAIDVVLNLAGPFVRTAEPLARRCIVEGIHYLDIAGEIAEVGAVRALDAEAVAAGSMLMPGVGFGVVPTDCLALHVAGRVDRPVHLDIAFATDGGVSAGTLVTMTSGFGNRGAVASPDLARKDIAFATGERSCLQNPWRADLETAPISTGVDDVTTWIAVPAVMRRAIESAHRRGDVEKPPMLARLLRTVASRLPAGPSAKKLASGSAQVWAAATGVDGDVAAATLTTPDAYVHTVDAALAIVRAVEGGDVAAGFRTPAEQYGPDFVIRLPGVVRTDS